MAGKEILNIPCIDCGSIIHTVAVNRCRCDVCKKVEAKRQTRKSNAKYRKKLANEAVQAKKDAALAKAEDKLRLRAWLKNYRKAKELTPERLTPQLKSVLRKRSGETLNIPEPTYYDNLYFPTPPAATGSLTEGSGSGHHVGIGV